MKTICTCVEALSILNAAVKYSSLLKLALTSHSDRTLYLYLKILIAAV
jgi:hypothetical protein